MKDKLNEAITCFFHDMSIAELRLQNRNYQDKKLTYNSMLYLNIIGGNQGKYTASNIADMLYVAKPAVIQKINELEREGYIRKKQSETDKRVLYLYLTEKGFLEETETLRLDNQVALKIAERYSEEEITDFLNMLCNISKLYSE